MFFTTHAYHRTPESNPSQGTWYRFATRGWSWVGGYRACYRVRLAAGRATRSAPGRAATQSEWDTRQLFRCRRCGSRLGVIRPPPGKSGICCVGCQQV